MVVIAQAQCVPPAVSGSSVRYAQSLQREKLRRRTPRIYLGILFWFLSSVVSPVSAQITVDQARDRGLVWLTTHQKTDGSWRSKPGTQVPATAAAVEAFSNAGLKNFAYARGVAWLNNASSPSVDSLARQLTVLVGAQVNVSRLHQKLLQWRNGNLAWGAYEGFQTSFPDTTFALRAMRIGGPYPDLELGNGLCRILVAQKTGDPSVNGSWSNILPVASAPVSAISSSIMPTTSNIVEIAAIKVAKNWSNVTCGTTNYDLQARIDSGIDWLLTQRKKADGGFGDGSASTIFETALVYPVLLALRASDPATSNALAYLINRQASDGSWNGDALQTAFVLKSFAAPISPCRY